MENKSLLDAATSLTKTFTKEEVKSKWESKGYIWAEENEFIFITHPNLVDDITDFCISINLQTKRYACYGTKDDIAYELDLEQHNLLTLTLQALFNSTDSKLLELYTMYKALYEVHKETVQVLRKYEDEASFYKEVAINYDMWRISLLNNRHLDCVDKLWEERNKKVECDEFDNNTTI